MIKVPVCYTNYSSEFVSEYNSCFRTSATVRENKYYIHDFGSKEIILPSMLCSYTLTVTTNKDTSVKLYTSINSSYYYSLNTFKLGKYDFYRKTFTCKSLLVYTKNSCILTINIRAVPCVIPPIEIEKNDKGHCEVITSYHKSKLLYRTPIYKSVSVCTMISSLKYYQSLGSLITLTTSVKDDYKYPPYSVKVCGASILSYRIRTSPSAGEKAIISITAIETLSPNSYSVISTKDKALINEHKGSLIEGYFEIPEGCGDIGLHIYTPYGFSCDIGEDPSKDLASFEEFSLY